MTAGGAATPRGVETLCYLPLIFAFEHLGTKMDTVGGRILFMYNLNAA